MNEEELKDSDNVEHYSTNELVNMYHEIYQSVSAKYFSQDSTYCHEIARDLLKLKLRFPKQ